MLQLWVRLCCRVNIGNVIMRRQDTSCARVQVVKPLVGDLVVAQVLNPCYLLPSTLGEERVLQIF